MLLLPSATDLVLWNTKAIFIDLPYLILSLSTIVKITIHRRGTATLMLFHKKLKTYKYMKLEYIPPMILPKKIVMYSEFWCYIVGIVSRMFFFFMLSINVYHILNNLLNDSFIIFYPCVNQKDSTILNTFLTVFAPIKFHLYKFPVWQVFHNKVFCQVLKWRKYAHSMGRKDGLVWMRRWTD